MSHWNNYVIKPRWVFSSFPFSKSRQKRETHESAITSFTAVDGSSGSALTPVERQFRCIVNCTSHQCALHGIVTTERVCFVRVGGNLLSWREYRNPLIDGCTLMAVGWGRCACTYDGFLLLYLINSLSSHDTFNDAHCEVLSRLPILLRLSAVCCSIEHCDFNWTDRRSRSHC